MEQMERSSIQKALRMVLADGNPDAMCKRRLIDYAADHARHGMCLIETNGSDDVILGNLEDVVANLQSWRGDDAKYAKGILRTAIHTLAAKVRFSSHSVRSH